MDTATITVTRREPADVKQREVFLSLDGERIATLLYGESVRREIEPGRHSIRAHSRLEDDRLHRRVRRTRQLPCRQPSRLGHVRHARAAGHRTAVPDVRATRLTAGDLSDSASASRHGGGSVSIYAGIAAEPPVVRCSSEGTQKQARHRHERREANQPTRRTGANEACQPGPACARHDRHDIERRHAHDRADENERKGSAW